MSWTGSTLIVARSTELAEQLLTDGELRCPLCNTGQLVAWGYGRQRIVRDRGGTTVTVRPRHTRCRSCSSTHIVMPAALQPRHADTTAVIGTALLHKAKGLEIPAHRDRHRPARVHGAALAAPSVSGTPGTHLPRRHPTATGAGPDTFTALRNTGTMLHYALSVLSAAAYWDRHRYALDDPPWTLIGLYTRGPILAAPG